MNLDYLPGAERDPATMSGTYVPATGWKVVIHSTESDTIEAAQAAYRSHKGWPHATVDPRRRRKVQHIPFPKAARALARKGVVPTNGAHAIQFEVVGRAAKMHLLPEADRNWLADEVFAPVMRAYEIPAVAPRFYGLDAGFTLATANAPQRMGAVEWLRYSGVVGHQHVPGGNTHWDPGRLDMGPILRRIYPSTPQEANAMGIYAGGTKLFPDASPQPNGRWAFAGVTADGRFDVHNANSGWLAGADRNDPGEVDAPMAGFEWLVNEQGQATGYVLMAEDGGTFAAGVGEPVTRVLMRRPA